MNKTKAQEKDASTEDVPKTPADTPKESVADYKAELEEAQARATKAEEKLKKAEYTLKKKNTDKGDKEIDSPSFSKDDLEELLEQKLSERISTVRAVESQDDVDDVLHHISKDEDERALIRHIYDNRISKTGYSRSQIREDLEAARDLANTKRIKKENEELVAAMSSRASLGTASMGSNVGKTPQLQDDYKKVFSQTDLQYMTSRGFTEDQMKVAAADIIANKAR